MANKNSSVPSWLSEVKEDAVKTNEWNDLTKQIYDAVDQHLSQNHVSYFTDLTDEEKNVLLERAARSLSNSDNGKIYENLQSKLSYLLDQSVNNQVAKKLIEENTFETKTDLVLDTTYEGIITLLRKHPDQKHKLRVFLNQFIPQQIKFLAWQLYFSNTNHRKQFISKLATNPKLCLSPNDVEIQRKCENILHLPMFSDIANSRGYSNSLKGVLSYYHSTFNIRRNLCDSEYLFGVPIVYSHYPPLQRNENPTEKSMATFIEIYLQFIQTLPTAVAQSIEGLTDNPEMELLVKSVENILQEYDPTLIDYIRDTARRSSQPGIEEITFLTGLKSICSPMISNLFSGYLNLNPLMFVWDQYAIGSDVSGYNEELIPIIEAIILMILRDQIMITNSFAEMDECLKNQACFIQTRQLQTLFNKYFFKNLQSKINNSTRLVPVIDPTAGRLQPWEHWHQDLIPRRAIKQKESDNSNERIQDEINRRLQAEKAAKEEIERLRRELNSLKKNNQYGPLPPKKVTSPVGKQEPQFESESVQPKKNNPISQNPSLDIFNKLKTSIDKIIHGENENKNKLDTQTIEDLRLHKLDLKIAENQVFGHQLAPGEWDSLSDREKKQRSDQMLDIVKQRLEKRFNETGRF